MSESGTTERDAVALASGPARSPLAEVPVDPATDARLLDAARAGDADAFAELWSLHRGAAYAVARSVVPGSADDVVSDAYATIWAQLQRGAVPEGPFRAHLLDTVRGVSAKLFRVSRQVVAVPAVEDVTDPVAEDALDSVEERAMIVHAFAALPDRWQQVLQWRAVERISRAEAARRLGISPNSVSVLGRRAIEGLRVAWLAQWLPTPPNGIEHARVFEALPRYVRDSLPRERAALLRSHLRGCTQCRSAERQLVAANRRLGGGLLGILFLGGAGSALIAALRAAEPVVPSAFTAAGASAAHGAAAIRPLAGFAGLGALRAGLGKVAAVAGGKITIGSTGLVLGATLSAAVIAGTVVIAQPFQPQQPITSEAGNGWNTARNTGPDDNGSAPGGAPQPTKKRTAAPPVGSAGVEPGAGLGRITGQSPAESDPQQLADGLLSQRQPTIPDAPLTPKPAPDGGDRVVPPPPVERPETPKPLPAPVVQSSGDSGGTIAPRLSGSIEPGTQIVVEVAGERVVPAVAADGRWTTDLASVELPAGRQRAEITQRRGDRVSNAEVVTFTLGTPKVLLSAVPVRAVDTSRFAALVSISDGAPGATVCVSAGATAQARITLDSRGASDRRLVLYPLGTRTLVFAYCDGDGSAARFGVRQRIAVPSQTDPGAPAVPESPATPVDPGALESTEAATGSAD